MKIRAYLDFDGTLTAARGEATVNSQFYKQLLEVPSIHYMNATFRADLQQMIDDSLAAGLGAEFGVTREAKAFVNRLIELDAEIIIISKNRPEYIRAMLVNANIATDSLIIYGVDIINVTLNNSKKGVVQFYESVHVVEEVGRMLRIVCDDNPYDLSAMMDALKDKDGEYTLYEQAAPGEFNWDMLIEKIECRQPIRRKPSLLSRSDTPVACRFFVVPEEAAPERARPYTRHALLKSV